MANTNTAGTIVASYTYDAWGNIISATGNMAAINPIRYRGYYWDSETGYYWLETRYYSPGWRRFINADSLFIAGDELTAANMYAYCDGNPVMYVDPSGKNAIVRAAWKRAFGYIQPKEVALINKHPGKATVALTLAGMAVASAILFYGIKGIKDGSKGNAYIHAYWSAMMTIYLGLDMALKFSAAHENQDPEIYSKLTYTKNAKGEITSIGYGLGDRNAEMDLFNNFAGLIAGLTFSIFSRKSPNYAFYSDLKNGMDYTGAFISSVLRDAISNNYLYWLI